MHTWKRLSKIKNDVVAVNYVKSIVDLYRVWTHPIKTVERRALMQSIMITETDCFALCSDIGGYDTASYCHRSLEASTHGRHWHVTRESCVSRDRTLSFHDTTFLDTAFRARAFQDKTFELDDRAFYH